MLPLTPVRHAGEVSKMTPAVQSSFVKMSKGDVAEDKFWK